ncbi:Dipeptide and tripeptide permease A [Raoultella planticola]|nr:Dipeptide and tripeptide permease A [Raoultella planticola]
MCQLQNNKPAESVSLNAFKQPKSFYLIFSIELWERFGYYGLQGIMAVYLVKQLGMSEADSITLFSSFSALVYGLVAIGGWLGDKVLGTKRVIMLGTIVLAIGYALVAYSGHDAAIVYMGMATIAVGNGLFKANPSSLLSTCYEKDDPRLDGAFTMYYMSINIGFLLLYAGYPVAGGEIWLEHRLLAELRRDADYPGELHVLQKMGKKLRFEA